MPWPVKSTLMVSREREPVTGSTRTSTAARIGPSVPRTPKVRGGSICKLGSGRAVGAADAPRRVSRDHPKRARPLRRDVAARYVSRSETSSGRAAIPLRGDQRRVDHGGVAPPPRRDPRRRAEAEGSSDRRVRLSRSGEAHPDSDLDLLVDFEPGASLLDHIGLFQDLEDLLGVGVDVVARSALKTRDDHIRAEAVDL